MIITIDGTSGTGKSTVARKVAEALRFTFFDTGAMYRSVAWYLLKKEVLLTDQDAIRKALDHFFYRVKVEGQTYRYFVDGTDVTDAIRTEEITKLASQTAAILEVRNKLWALQRDFAKQGNSVFEGRDMGTIVFPQADLKVFLTAKAEVRAERRLKELMEKYPGEYSSQDYQRIYEEILKRDAFDSSRELAPLRCPEGALVIDTSDLSIGEVVKKILRETKAPRMKPFYRFIYLLAKEFFKLFYRHKVYGLEHTMRGGAILAANHSSFYDPPILSTSWPEEVHFLAISYLFRIPILGFIIRHLNAHPVSGEASDAAVFKMICQLLEGGKKVILFPEGTRSETDALGPMKPGISLFLSRTGCAIIPAYIHGTFKIWNRFHKFPKLTGRTACVFGSPIKWEEFASLDKKTAQKAISDRLFNAIQNLKSWYESGAQGTPP